MKILILNGSPHLDGATSDMTKAFSDPICYFTLSAQLQAVIHRTYAIDIPKNVKKVALIMTSNGRQNKTAKKRKELYKFGRSL